MDEKQQYANDYLVQVLRGLEELSNSRNMSMLPDVFRYFRNDPTSYQRMRMSVDHHDVFAPGTLQNIRHAVTRFPEQNWRDALSIYQIKSKRWLINEIAEHIGFRFHQVYVLGGWLGILPYLMQSEGFLIEQTFNLDTDQSVLEPSCYINNESLQVEGYFASAMDAYKLNYTDDKIIPQFPSVDKIMIGNPDLIINTICEHLADYSAWINQVPFGKKVALQSNNMHGIDGHVNCVDSLDEFVAECQLSDIAYANTLELGDTWKRFMIIGTR